MRIFLGLLVALGVAGCARTATERPAVSLSTARPYAVLVGIVNCRVEYERECLHFYENNWKVYREEALKRKVISGYQLLRTGADSTSTFTLLMTTEFADSLTFARVEDNFQPIMRSLRPSGPELLNAVLRNTFVESSSSYTMHPLDPSGY